MCRTVNVTVLLSNGIDELPLIALISCFNSIPTVIVLSSVSLMHLIVWITWVGREGNNHTENRLGRQCILI
jgi:hypothetical protein